MHLFTYITKLFSKIGVVFQQPWVWLTGLGLFVTDAATRGRLTIYLVVVACVVDLICGIAVAIKRKRFAKSELMRLTVEKLLVYGSVMLVFLCIDGYIASQTDFQLSLTSALVGIVITMTELWSVLASLLILFPKNPLLKVLQGKLTEEIASKLGVDKDEVAAILNASRKKPQPRAKNGQFVAKKEEDGETPKKKVKPAKKAKK